jgi:serine/threonine-protein phosphatase 5
MVDYRLDPRYVKAYYRRGSANYAMGKLKEAKADFKAVVKIVPTDTESVKKVKACDKALRERALAEALETEEIPVMSDVDVNAIVVDASYDGPRLPEPVTSVDDAGNTIVEPIVVSIDFVKHLIEYFRAQKSLHRKYVLQLLLAAKQYFSSLPTLLRIPLPTLPSGKLGHFTVCGDTHGQYYDLVNIFEIGGFPSPTNPFLFNGDFVDRGSFSFETVTLLIAMKLAMPDSLYMLRGNHESKYVYYTCMSVYILTCPYGFITGT